MQANNSVSVLTNLVGFIKTGLETNEIRLGTGQYIDKTGIANIRVLCRTNARPRSIRVKPAIYAVNNGLGYESGFKIIIERDSTPQTVETYLNIDTYRDYVVPVANTSVAISTIVTALVAKINEVDRMDNRTFPITSFTAIVDPTDSDYVLITGNYPGLFNVYNPYGGSLTAVVVKDPGYEGTLLDIDVKREFPMLMDYVPGSDVPREWQGCKNPCVITINGSVSADKADQWNAQGNLVQMGKSGFNYHYEFWVNKDDSNYAQFLTDLATFTGVTPTHVTPNNLNLIAGTDLTATVGGGNVTIGSPSGQLTGATMDYGATATLVNASGSSFTIPNASPTTDGVFSLSGIAAGVYTAIIPITYTLASLTRVGTINFTITVP
jgi:hypothetical protein